jgi:hypothetical protein
MTIAAVVLFTGCGGGSGNKGVGTKNSASTESVGGRQVVSAKDGTFSTVIPLGYTYSPSGPPQYEVRGPKEKGIVDTMIVIHEPVRRGDMNAYARRTLRAVRQQPGLHQLSQLRRLSVGGEPALAIDYVLPALKTEAHISQVLIGHGEWVYIIRADAPTTGYATASGALEEVIGNWKWR